MKQNKRIFILRPWFIAAMVIGIAGGSIYEWLWRTRVESGDQAAAIVAWTKQNTVLRERVGEISSVSIDRKQTVFSLSLGDSSSGCYHYVLNATHGPAEVWVTWHQEAANHPVVVEKLELRTGDERHVIWAIAK